MLVSLDLLRKGKTKGFVSYTSEKKRDKATNCLRPISRGKEGK